jgi:peptide/nickel transport system permease protein
VLSRVLWGGRTTIGLGVIATLLAYTVGATIGLVAGLGRSVIDPILMRVMDIFLAFPPLLFLLILATGAGASGTLAVVGVAVIQVPGIARVIRAATQEVSVRGYVEAAVARGEPGHFILFREVLPNIANTIAADMGLRLTGSILLIAGLNFLGLGLQPPIADWALMITENRPGLTFQPWAVVVPALLIAVLTIGVNLLADAVARSLGKSVEPESLRR